MLDRIILLILFGLIGLYTVTMAWMNGKDPPD
jgi:hypothetical protein